MLYYIYNGDELLGFVYKNKKYYYHKNILGDIIGILDSDYNEIVTYEYDSWGALVYVTDNSNINLGTINPFRYRSYYYDEETKLYYLNSRYYNPEFGRFINADSMITGQGFNGNNVFIYVNNNSINNSDKIGQKFTRPTKRLAKTAWRAVIKGLEIIGLVHSAALLKNSLNDNPKSLKFDKNSELSKKISQDSDYKNKMSKILETADSAGNISYDSRDNKDLEGIVFNKDNDLFGSIHGANIKVEGNIYDGKLNVLITDYYDFKWESEYYDGGIFKSVALFGNNLAFLDQCTGVINGYYIDVNLEYEIE